LPVSRRDSSFRQTVERYVDVLPELRADCEILLVRNGTRAGDAICRALATGGPVSVKMCSDTCEHWGDAIRAGLRSAGGDVLAYTDAVRTPPEALVAALRYSLQDPDVVVRANRRTRDTRLRKLGSLLFNIECRLLLGVSSWDVNGTPKVFRRHHQRLLELR